tara:strand:- start:226 stop:480 length:255 start_codon:yes stop_codon:yes gene_type:complete
MKIIVENSTNLCKYLFDDNTNLSIQATHIEVGDPANLDFIIGDLNSGNSTLIENITNSPADWIGNKYTFDGTTWTQNPDWVDPE